MDRFAVIWTRFTGQPIKLADMVLNEERLRITKTDQAVDMNVPGVSLLHDLAGMRTIDYPRSMIRLPPQLQTLLPPPDATNPQRIVLETLLAREIDVRGMPILDKEWHMLTFAGHGGIGHLDVFKTDADAMAFYAKPPMVRLHAKSGSEFWAAFRRLAQNIAHKEDEDKVLDVVGPTPAVSGFVPKLIVPISLRNGSWDGTMGGDHAVPAIVKLETYPGLCALEELAYAYHRKAGMNVPRTWVLNVEHQDDMLRLLAIERFDRRPDGRPIPLESMFSLLRTGNPSDYIKSTDGSMEKIDQVLSVPGLVTNINEQKKELFRRFVLAILTGNGDMHSENVAILGGLGEANLSPVFDPSPMRAYRYWRRNHNILSALPFDGIGGVAEIGEKGYNDYTRGATPPNLGEHLVRWGKSMEIKESFCRDEIARLLDVTQGFHDDAMNVLAAIPANDRKPNQPDQDGFLVSLREVRSAIEASFANKAGPRHTAVVTDLASHRKPKMR